jgi:hypothetical protein
MLYLFVFAGIFIRSNDSVRLDDALVDKAGPAAADRDQVECE